MLEGEEAASTSGQSVTIEEFADAVSDSVSVSVVGTLEGVTQRLDGLESGLQEVSDRVQVVSASMATREDLQAASASLEEAALQAGEVGPVLDEEIGPVIITLIGDLLDAFDTDGDGASDVASVVTEIRQEVGDISATLVHPAMSTPFSDYSVTEALLLLLVLWELAIKPCLSMLRRGFGWLMS